MNPMLNEGYSVQSLTMLKLYLKSRFGGSSVVCCFAVKVHQTFEHLNFHNLHKHLLLLLYIKNNLNKNIFYWIIVLLSCIRP